MRIPRQQIGRREFVANLTGVASGTLFAGCRIVDGCGTDRNLTVMMSDIHVTGDGTRFTERFSYTHEELHRRIDEILALRPRPARVVTFGDIAFNEGEPSAYAFAARAFARIEAAGIEVVHGMGNHDRHEAFFAAFPDAARLSPVPGKAVRTVDLGTADLILLDSQWNGHVNGNLDDAQQQWLAKVLPDWKRPVFVGAHHPAEELKVCGRPMVKFLIDCPGVKGWIFGHHHEWRKSCLHAYGGANNKDLIRSLTLPSATYCGDIGFVRFETSADRAVASLDEKGFWFEQRLRPGERVPALWEAVVEENRGDTCAFPYERPLRTI